MRLGSGNVNNTSLVLLECGRLLRANFTGYEMVSVKLWCFMPHENIMQLLQKWKYTIPKVHHTNIHQISTFMVNKKKSTNSKSLI